MSDQPILVLTVGGSYQPVLKSLQQTPAARVYFLCSVDQDRAKGSYHQVNGQGNVLKSRPDLSGPDLPCLATLAHLEPDRYEVHTIEHFDDLSHCYLAAAEAIEQARRSRPDARIVVDYTGGTKSMSAGLAAAALDDGRCKIRLVAGMRANLEKVADGTEYARPVPVLDLQSRRRLRFVAEFLKRFDYASAARLLEETLSRGAGEGMESRLREACNLCRAFDAWDRFDHRQAAQLLAPIGRGVADAHRAFLTVMLSERATGFELLEDLLRNAERRAAQGRYDDAVGRLYRAIELCAQQWLHLKYSLDTSDLALERVPEEFREETGLKSALVHSPVKIGLRQAWQLICAFPDDPLGRAFAAIENRVMDFLSLRNN
ncbi:MAG: TIGR02710 family CRISPR-associated CARF protein, partial [Thermoguttaceae bacterium]|nr:TIGR02710 family CRISPR-associated CARF protein [Thermoguttaceae bacterium]